MGAEFAPGQSRVLRTVRIPWRSLHSLSSPWHLPCAFVSCLWKWDLPCGNQQLIPAQRLSFIWIPPEMFFLISEDLWVGYARHKVLREFLTQTLCVFIPPPQKNLSADVWVP